MASTNPTKATDSAMFAATAILATVLIGYIAVRLLSAERSALTEGSIDLPPLAEIERTWNEYIAIPRQERERLRRDDPAPNKTGRYFQSLGLAREWNALKAQQLAAMRQQGIHPETIDIEIASVKQSIALFAKPDRNETWPRQIERHERLRQLREDLAWWESKKRDGTPVTPTHELPYQKRLDHITRWLADDVPIGAENVSADWGLLLASTREEPRWREKVWNWLKERSKWDLLVYCLAILFLAFAIDALWSRGRQQKIEAATSEANREAVPVATTLPEPAAPAQRIELTLSRSPPPDPPPKNLRVLTSTASNRERRQP